MCTHHGLQRKPIGEVVRTFTFVPDDVAHHQRYHMPISIETIAAVDVAIVETADMCHICRRYTPAVFVHMLRCRRADEERVQIFLVLIN